MGYFFVKMLVLSLKENDEPHFGQISDLFIVHNQLLLLHTIQFSEHYHATIVRTTTRHMYVWANDFMDFHVYGMYSKTLYNKFYCDKIQYF